METRNLTIPTPAGSLRARFYRPDKSDDVGPCLVFFHGGGFVLCDLETHDALCRRLADAGRMRVLSVEYRLAPEAPFPAQLDDGEAAVRWAIRASADLQIDPAGLLLGGDSAGAYIAVATAAQLNCEQEGSIAALVLIYPLLELRDEAWNEGFTADTRFVGRAAVGFIRQQLQLTGSPPSLAGIGLDPLPPMLIVVGGPLDPCRADAMRLAARMREAAKPMTLLEFPRLPHGFASLTHLSRASQRAVTQIGRAAAVMTADA